MIIPLHNRRELISYTLDSVRPERHAGVRLQVIVVDDGSTDNGGDFVESQYPWVDVIRQPSRGASAARNCGLEHATGTFVLYLDSDDLVEEGFFEPRMAALEGHPSAAGAYGPWDVFESDGAFAESTVRPRHGRYPIVAEVDSSGHLRRLLRGWYIVGPATLWRRDVLRDVGGHDPTLIINQDVELMFRILTTTCGIVGVDAPRALTRQHGGARQGLATSPDAVRQVAELRRRFRAELERLGIFDEQLRRALAEYAFDSWAHFKGVAPEESHDLLLLSRDLWPEMNVRGGALYRALGVVLGPARATIVKERLRRLIS
ncbi:MAG TPA: glycosyltransferase [Rhodothermales bacterium]